MHENLKSQGKGRCVVCASSLSDAVLLLPRSKNTGHFQSVVVFP
jgi:hypothetical protein